MRIVEVVRKQLQKLGRNEEQDVSRKRGEKWSKVMKSEQMEWERKVKWENERVYRWVGTADHDPRPTPAQPEQPSLISAPSNPHCWWLYGGAAERDDHRRTVTSDCKSSSSWREQTKRWTKGQRRGQMPYGACTRNKTGVKTSSRTSETDTSKWCGVRRFQWTGGRTEESCHFLHAATWSRRLGVTSIKISVWQ